MDPTDFPSSEREPSKLFPSNLDPTTSASPNLPPPWRRFAVPTPPDATDRPILALVIDDLGHNRAAAERILEIAAPITVAILPSAVDADALSSAAQRAGKEVLLHLPMEPVGAQDPGPDAILTSLSQEEIAARLEAHMAAFDGYVGVNNHMGSAATANAEVMRQVLEPIDARGLLFLDSRTSSESWGWRLAKRRGMPSAVNQVFLDNEIDRDAILERLDDAAASARRLGASVAIGHPHEATIDAITIWVEKKGPDDVALVPLTTVVERLMTADAPAADDEAAPADAGRQIAP